MPLRVLVVDDEPIIRMSLVYAITDAGMVADEASDAAEALELLNRAHYDVVLSDVTMPGSHDGRALADRVLERWPSTRVVLMSGNFDPRSLPPHISCLKKPFPLESLVSRFAEIVVGEE